jgi:uncharacterized membrane protein (UPF0182 family)
MKESIESIYSRQRQPRGLRRGLLLILAVLAVIFFSSRTVLSYYIDSLWFGSLGYAEVFRKTISMQWLVFAAFFAATFFILYGWFLALARAYQSRLVFWSALGVSAEQVQFAASDVSPFPFHFAVCG